MIKEWFKDFVYAGWRSEQSADVRKQHIICSLFSLISFVLLIMYGIDNILIGNKNLAFVVFAFAAVNGLNYLFLRKSGNYKTSSIIIVILMVTLCLYLLCNGGSSNTGPLWFFVLPNLIFYILGLQRGLVALTALLTLTLYILYFPDNPLLHAEYSIPFIQRFTGALFSVSVVALVYEYTREDGRRELLELSKKYDLLSRKDELTGLSNRRDIIEKLKDEVSRFERTGHVFSVLMADVDHFKKINDTYGHECGDYTLKKIGSTFLNNTQKRDVVARWGGEEFLIFLPETGVEQALKTAERLRLAIEKNDIRYGEGIIKITTSFGAAAYHKGQTIDELIKRSDISLYQAKKQGRNRVVNHSSD